MAIGGFWHATTPLGLPSRKQPDREVPWDLSFVDKLVWLFKS